MMKKLISVKHILASCLMVCLLVITVLPVHAENEDWNDGLYRVNDFAQVLKESQFDAVEDMAYDNVEVYRFDFPIVTAHSSDMGDWSSLSDFADYYYEQNGYGYGANKDGVLFVLVDDKDQYLIKGFGRGAEIFTDEVVSDLKETYYTTYYAQGYQKGFLAYLEAAQAKVAAGISGDSDSGVSYDFQEGERPAVYDAAQIFTDSEKQEMTALIQKIAADHGYDVVVYTDVTSYGKSRALQAADFYWDNGYGMGGDRSGSVLFICMEEGNRGWWSAGTGEAQSYFTASTINDLDDRLEPYMVEGDYGEGVIHYLEDLDYLYEHGSVPRTKHYFIGVLIALVAGLVAGLTNRMTKTAQMNTLREAKAATDYVIPGSLQVRAHNDRFLRKNVSCVKRVPKDTDSGGGGGGSTFSGGYHSSGGGSFSGGGRSF